jgi:hypothetical protein
MLSFEWCETDTLKENIDKYTLTDFQFFTQQKHQSWSYVNYNKWKTLEIFLCSEDHYI